MLKAVWSMTKKVLKDPRARKVIYVAVEILIDVMTKRPSQPPVLPTHPDHND